MDARMLGLREQTVDFPYDMISSVKLDKGAFSCNVIFTSAGLRNSGRRGMIERPAGTEYNGSGEEAVITAIPKDKAEELLEVIRNGMDIQRETLSTSDKAAATYTSRYNTVIIIIINNNQQSYQLLMNWLSLLNSKNKE
jgi:hypothetical protein